MRGGDHRGVLGEPEVVVRRERHHGAAVGRERAVGPGGVEVARRAPLAGGADRRRPRRRPTRPRSRSPRHVVVDLVDRVVQRVHDAVELLRRDRERRHQDDDVAERAEQHAARRPRPRTPAGPSAGRRAAARARRRPSGRAARTSRDRGMRRDAVVEQRRAARRSGPRTLASTSHASSSSRWRSATAARERVPAVRVPVVQRPLRRGRGRGTRRTPRPTRPSPTSAGSRAVMPLPRHSRSGRMPALLATRTACRCGRSRSRPRRRSAARRARGTRRRARARSSGSASCMPAAPCTSGSTITAASSDACARDQPDRLGEAVGIVERRARAAPGSAAGRRVGAEAAVADRERADRVAVVRAAEREERGAARRRRG